MKFLRNAALCLAATLTSASSEIYFKPHEVVANQVIPGPGSISSTMYVPSLDNILARVVPLAAKELFTNYTLDINYSAKGLFGIYNIEIDSLTTNSIKVKDTSLSFVPNTDTLQLTLSGVDIDATLIGKATAIKLIPASIDAFTIQNLTIVLQLNTSSDDGVHFTIGGASFFHIDDFTLTMGQKIW